MIGDESSKGSESGPKRTDFLPNARFVPRVLLFVSLAVAVCVADLWSKQAVFAWRGWPGEQDVWWLVPQYAGIQTALNAGALFGMGQGRGIVFAVLSIAAAIAILTWIIRLGAWRDLWLTLALGCTTGGILGNLYDRLGFWYAPPIDPRYRHAVRDWILLQYGEHTWPNFNIADSFLVLGAFLLMLLAWRRPAERVFPDAPA